MEIRSAEVIALEGIRQELQMIRALLEVNHEVNVMNNRPDPEFERIKNMNPDELRLYQIERGWRKA